MVIIWLFKHSVEGHLEGRTCSMQEINRGAAQWWDWDWAKDRDCFQICIWDISAEVSLCWSHKADHVVTPLEGSWIGRGSQAPLMTVQHGFPPQLHQLWLEWLLRLAQWPPPLLQYWTERAAHDHFFKNQILACRVRICCHLKSIQRTLGCVDMACHVWLLCSRVQPLACYLPVPETQMGELWRGNLREVEILSISIIRPRVPEHF